jgi:type III pantothenate kinase
MEERIIAIDIGNSTVDIGCIDIGAAQCVDRVSVDTRSLDTTIVSRIDTLAEKNAVPSPLTVVISSVVVSCRPRYDSLFDDRERFRAVWISSDTDLPITMKYKDSRSLGTDRLANALYCHYRFAHRTAVVIDAGTTITVDCVENGECFAGGVIIPGVSMQAAALHRGTDALPEVRALNGFAITFPGMSTDECIQAGVVLGTAGAVSRCVEKYREHYGSDIVIIATGGSWGVLKNNITFPADYIPDLTLIGAGMYLRTRCT